MSEAAQPEATAAEAVTKRPLVERVAKAMLNLSPKSRIVLLGAGASREAGFPIAAELDHVFRNSDLPIYSEIAAALSDRLDVERVLRLMELLADIGPDAVAQDLARLDVHLGRLRTFANTPESLADRLNVELKQIMDVLKISLWKQPAAASSSLSMARRPPPQPWDYLKPLISAQRGSTIATLNYDNALELAGGKAVRTAKDAAVISTPGVSDSYARVLKLHGSIDWKRVDEDVTRSNGPFSGISYQPAIIFGSGNKLRHYGPFLELLREFQVALARADQLTVIGYGWRDAHINAEIKRWARTRNREKYLKVNVMPGEAQPRLVSHIEGEYRHVLVKVFPQTASEMIRKLF